MDLPILVLRVEPVKDKGYFTVTELGYESTPRFKAWGKYAKQTDRPKTGSDFASLLARAKSQSGTEDEPTEPAPEAPEPSPPATKRRRVAI
jgi:hypothetical protein